MLDSNLQFYADIGAALFPLPAGSKIPGPKEFWEVEGRAGSFKHHCSRDPAQWEHWRSERPGCNFGLVAFASGLVVCDIDTSGGEAGKVEAWQAWVDLCTSWGLSEPLAPYCQSASGGWHVLFKIPPDIDPKTLHQPDAIKGRINIRCIGYVVTAGSTFEGNLYQLYPDAGAPYPAPAALLEHCAPSKPRDNLSKIGTHDFGDVAKLYGWMAENGVIQTDEEWRTCGMAAKLEFGDNGFALWEIVAQKLWDEPIDGQNETRWRSFATEPTANAVTMDSIFKLAHDNGWKGAVRQSTESMFSGLAQLASVPAAPIVGYDMANLPLPQNSEEPDLDIPFIEPIFPEQNGDDWTPPDYIVDGIFQRRYCYSLTAQTDTGKTNVALLLAAHVAEGRHLGSIEIERGTVLYFAGENPEDVKGRWFALCREMGLSHKKVDVIFVYGTTQISKTIRRYHDLFEARGTKLSLVIVDTAAAYFEGDKEDDNHQAGNHARLLRTLRYLPGDPCVLTLCHPTKGAKTLEEMIPRGGSAFVNEVDGNLGLARDEAGNIVAAKVHKFRGNAFNPLHFALKVIHDHPMLVDIKGRQQTTVIAEPISGAEVERRQERASNDEDKVLKVLCDNVGMKNSDICKAMGWTHSEKARRMLKSLADQGLAASTKNIWIATPKGQKYINTVATTEPVQPLAPITPANLGTAPYPMPAASVTRPPMPPR